MAKQISSGYAPIAGLIAAEHIADGFAGSKADAFVGGSTFGAHPVACAVALASATAHATGCAPNVEPPTKASALLPAKPSAICSAAINPAIGA